MESLENAFAAQATRVRLIGPRELTPRPAVAGHRRARLRSPLRRAGCRADRGGDGPGPRLLALPERTVTAERIFTVEQPAAANRVSAIVEAFDIATRDLNTQIVAWTDANAG